MSYGESAVAALPTPAEPDPAARVARLRRELRTQHRRYGIGDSPPQISRLELAVDQRHSRIAHLRRQIEEMQADVSRLQTEIAGYAKGLEALLADEVERIRDRFGESWSPTPVMGYRMWWLTEGKLEGARTTWTAPRFAAVCATTNSSPDEVPHSDGRCGRLGCGVYAAKAIRPLLRSLVDTRHRSYVVALVELHGKVVEHEHGYRGARAEVVAAGAVGRSRLLRTDDPALLDHLFRTPRSVMGDELLGTSIAGTNVRERIATYLENQLQRRNPWISANSSE